MSGTLDAGAVLQVPVNGGIHLGHQGDDVVLVDPSGASIDQVTYTPDDIQTGRTICFGR